MGTLLLLDGNSLVNRAYYGVKSTSTLSTAEGTPTNAVFGFVNILNKHLEDIRPDRIAVAFDTKAPTFRHALYDGYKGTRKGMPDELAVQMPLLKEVLDAMRIARIEQEGLEADDFIGILSHLGETAGEDVIIVTGDRDALQLVSERVTVMIPSTGRGGTETNVYTPEAVMEKYGVSAAALIEVKGLMGDSSDSIPGVPSVGEKTALGLIAQYQTIDGVYAHLDEITKPALLRNLTEFREQAYLSRTLGIIVREPDERVSEELLNLNTLAWQGPDKAKLRRVFEHLEFRSLIRKMGLAEVEPMMRAAVDGKDEAGAGKTAEHWLEPVVVKTETALQRMAVEVAAATGDMAVLLCDPSGTQTADALDADEQAGESDTVQMAMAMPQERSRRVLLALVVGTRRWIVLTGPDLSDATVATVFSGILGDHPVCTHDMKPLIRYFLESEVPVPSGLFDTLLAEYLLDAARDRYPLRDLAVRHLGVEGDTPDLLLQEAGRKAVEPSLLLTALAHSLTVLPRIAETQREKMALNGQTELYETVEAPLAHVLAEMERDGFKVDPDMLRAYGNTLQQRISALEGEIYELAGEVFTILSPKQLGGILFDKLGLPTGKKTKTGYSTNADVLESLVTAHPIVPAVLEYRQLTKLNSTYVDGLLKEISPVTARVHSQFNQTVAVTGRISSTEPNLQNIPIRTELGRLIRKAFVPKAGCVFIDADYSQIELRVLAHVTGDATLREAFLAGTDIHALTASQVFHVPLEEVTGEMRRRAKAVNFGIIYGISDYGLSQDLGIYRKEAAAYIDGYLNTYPGVRQYMTDVVEQAREAGYVETLLRRRRYLPELKSPNFNVRSFGKRVALNTPIQGTAADIIKLAMIRVRDALAAQYPKARLILQVHDELVIETPETLAEAVGTLVRACMEQAFSLTVPLVADVGTGPNWYDAKH